MTNSELDSRIAEWKTLTAWLAVAKEREPALRKEIAEAIFAGPFKEGTATTSLDTDSTCYKAKLVSKFNYKVDEAKARELNAPAIKWKPELSITEYRKLTDAEKNIANQCLTITPGAITLEIEAVKK